MCAPAHVQFEPNDLDILCTYAYASLYQPKGTAEWRSELEV